MTTKPKPFAVTVAFYVMFGRFYAVWTSLEITLDCAICKILKLPAEDGHVLFGPLEFGRKAAILRSLLPAANYKNEEQIKGLLTRIGKESLRNAFSHSFIQSEATDVTFVHRSGQGQYSVTKHTFTADEFGHHVDSFVDLAQKFELALGLTQEEIDAFANAAARAAKSE